MGVLNPKVCSINKCVLLVCCKDMVVPYAVSI
jgi:hypothetical protein